MLFDLDGVLWPSSAGHRRAFQKTLGEFGFTWKLKPQDYSVIAGMTTEKALEKLFRERHQPLRRDLIPRFAKRKRQWAQRILAKTRLESGLFHTLERLHRCLRLGLVSSSHPNSLKLFFKLSRARRFFDVVISQREAGVSKPHPKPYRIALKKLRLTGSEAVAVEDTLSGLESARACRIAVIGMRGTIPTSRLRNAGVIRLISRISELSDLCG